MKPVLIVDGKVRKVVNADWNQNGEIREVMVENDTTFEHHKIIDNPNVKLVWEGRYEPIREAILKRIESYEEWQLELAVRFIEVDHLPTEERAELQRDYHYYDEKVEKLTEVLGMIREVETGQTFEARLENFTQGVAQMFKSVVSVDARKNG